MDRVIWLWKGSFLLEGVFLVGDAERAKESERKKRKKRKKEWGLTDDTLNLPLKIPARRYTHSDSSLKDWIRFDINDRLHFPLQIESEDEEADGTNKWLDELVQRETIECRIFFFFFFMERMYWKKERERERRVSVSVFKAVWKTYTVGRAPRAHFPVNKID